MDVTRTIRYEGRPELAGFLAYSLRQEGVRVEWTPPEPQEEPRGIDWATDVQQVVVTLTAGGAAYAIKRAVDLFRERVRAAGGDVNVEIEGEEDDLADHAGRERMPETGWTGEPAEPEPQPRQDIVFTIFEALIHWPPEHWRQAADALAAAEHEWNAAIGLAIDDLNARHSDIHARIKELQRLTGSEGLEADPDGS
jgi:hypothetical protein